MTESPRRFTSDTQLDTWFGYHPPANPEVGLTHDTIRSNCRSIAGYLQTVLPEGPDKTVVFRKLQEFMWSANACLACNATPEYDPIEGKY